MLWGGTDLRFDAAGQARCDFVLNRPEYAGCRVLIGGENFGCGSSRGNPVWGLLQYGIWAIVAPSFGEIFYSDAMNNQLLLAPVPQAAVRMFVDGLDLVGASLSHQGTIAAFARAHWTKQPWLRSVAATTRNRLV
jgi:3-isopropylmalate/(R)-2-methylmalate dehydratase small subunit